MRFQLTIQLLGVPQHCRRTNRTQDCYELRINQEGCYLDLEEDQFVQQFRLKKSVFFQILDDLRPYIHVGTTRRTLTCYIPDVIYLHYVICRSYIPDIIYLLC